MSPITGLIVNADDFGLSPGVNRGIEEAFVRGIVTSASLMVCARAAEEAARFVRAHPDLGLGLHLDLGEWIHESGRWVAAYEVVPLSDPRGVRTEIAAQLTRFERLVGHSPTHIDSHQHVHLFDPVRAIVQRVHERTDIPVRGLGERVRHLGDFYGQTGEGTPIEEAITVTALLRLLDGLEPGVTELSCHPGRDDALDSVYARERSVEVDTLTDPRIVAHLARRGIRLVCHRDLSGSDRPRTAGRSAFAGAPA